MTIRRRFLIIVLSLASLLTGCNRGNIAKSYATKEAFVDYGSKNDLIIDFKQDEDRLCSGEHYDTERLISEAVKSIEFKSVSDKDEITKVESARPIAEASGNETIVQFRLYPDFMHATFYSSIRSGPLSIEYFTSYQSLKKEDGEWLFNKIKEAYKKGTRVENSDRCYF